jgi:hypothetical protein
MVKIGLKITKAMNNVFMDLKVLILPFYKRKKYILVETSKNTNFLTNQTTSSKLAGTKYC